MKTVIIALDGPAGAGKGTACKYLQSRYGLAVIESGLLYRLVAYCSKNNTDFKSYDILKGMKIPLLRQENIAETASIISQDLSVRTWVNQQIHKLIDSFKGKFRGVVVDGRDIATVVLPNADLKLFITADKDTRFERRKLEMNAMQFGPQNINIDVRDNNDINRTYAPLRAANDAKIIDTTNLTIKDFECVLDSYCSIFF